MAKPTSHRGASGLCALGILATLTPCAAPPAEIHVSDTSHAARLASAIRRHGLDYRTVLQKANDGSCLGTACASCTFSVLFFSTRLTYSLEQRRNRLMVDHGRGVGNAETHHFVFTAPLRPPARGKERRQGRGGWGLNIGAPKIALLLGNSTGSIPSVDKGQQPRSRFILLTTCWVAQRPRDCQIR